MSTKVVDRLRVKRDIIKPILLAVVGILSIALFLQVHALLDTGLKGQIDTESESICNLTSIFGSLINIPKKDISYNEYSVVVKVNETTIYFGDNLILTCIG